MESLPRHYEKSASLPAAAEEVFAYLDDHSRLSSHMMRSSWMMGGGWMKIDYDEDRGRRVGSRIGMAGKILGIELSLEQMVGERIPPLRKVWQTTGEPKLLVIGHYRMGFEIISRSNESSLRVFIDYDLPGAGLQRRLGRLFGRFYAKWCVDRMIEDAVKNFSGTEVQHA